MEILGLKIKDFNIRESYFENDLGKVFQSVLLELENVIILEEIENLIRVYKSE